MREDFKRPIRVITHVEEEAANHGIGYLIGMLISLPIAILVNIFYYLLKGIEFISIKFGKTGIFVGIFIVTFIISYFFFKGIF
jgi:hypothetical protein